jgi:hypothetical protein
MRSSLRHAMHLRVALGRASPGNATRQPGARCGTNQLVLGVAWKGAADGDHEPSASESRLVHGTMTLLPELASVTVKRDDAGIRRQAVALLTVPRSSDHKPPGVRGWFCGKARMRMAWHGPGVHVVFVTMSGTLRGGPADDEYVARRGSSSALQSRRWNRCAREALVS